MLFRSPPPSLPCPCRVLKLLYCPDTRKISFSKFALYFSFLNFFLVNLPFVRSRRAIATNVISAVADRYARSLPRTSLGGCLFCLCTPLVPARPRCAPNAFAPAPDRRPRLRPPAATLRGQSTHQTASGTFGGETDCALASANPEAARLLQARHQGV